MGIRQVQNWEEARAAGCGAWVGEGGCNAPLSAEDPVMVGQGELWHLTFRRLAIQGFMGVPGLTTVAFVCRAHSKGDIADLTADCSPRVLRRLQKLIAKNDWPGRENEE